MATTYPTTLDNFTNPLSSDLLSSASVPHATQHSDLNDAIEAVQAELGTLPKGASASVKARLDTLAPLASPTFTGTVVLPANLEFGHASDTTVARVSAGLVSIEGSNVIMASNKLSALSATTSLEFIGVISDETGTDKLVFNTSPTLVTPILGVAAATDLTTSGKTVRSVTNAISASAIQTQATGTALTADVNRVVTVTTAGDAVTLMAATAGREVTIINANVSNAVGVFPAVGDAINAVAVDAVSSLAAATTRTYSCAVAGTWNF